MMKIALLISLTALLWVFQAVAGPTVGMQESIEQLLLPGSEIEAKPMTDRKAPIIVRITDVFPHGENAFRYDLVYEGREPGEFDLRDYLQRKDGSTLEDIDPIPVTIESILPPGQILPTGSDDAKLPVFTEYRTLLLIAGALWFVGLAGILFLGKKKPEDIASNDAPRPLTLADRLRPLVEKGASDELTSHEKAALERLVLGLWRRRLDLENESVGASLPKLRAHPEAGPLLLEIESWLHRPAGVGDPVDVAALLRPYEKMASDALPELEKLETSSSAS